MTTLEDLVLVQTILTRYVLVICSILGLIGSLVNFIVFCQRRFRSNTCSIYFRGTSIFNILVILLGITPVFLTSYLPNERIFNTSIFCKTRSYVTHVFLMMSRFSVALACIDRYALCSPSAHIRRLNQRRLAIISIVSVSCLWLIIPIHIPIYIDYHLSERRCGATGIYSIIYSVYASIVTGIPLMIMFLFSFWTIQNLRNNGARLYPQRTCLEPFRNLPERMRRRDIQLLIMLTGEVTVYLLSTVWFPIYSIYVTITLNTPKTTDRLAIEGFIRYLVLSFLIFLNSCSIFYIHLFTSKIFREECARLLMRLCKSNRVNPNPLEEFNHVYQHRSKEIISNDNNLQMNPVFA